MNNLRYRILASTLLALIVQLPVTGQNEWDNSGNNLLNGTYYFRDAIWLTDDNGSNTLDEAVAQYGTIAFDGAGGYHIEGTAFSSANNQPQNFTLDGNYQIAASGFGFISRERNFGGVIYGAVAHGVFVGSSTESVTNNLFVASRRPNTPLTTATFNQSYTIAYLNFPTLSMSQVRDAQYRLQPNGAGGLAAMSLTGYIGSGRTPVAQNINTATYSVANGIGTLHFGGTAGGNTLLAGSHEFYVSADGAFIFGGSRTGFDMFVGIRTPESAVPAGALRNLYIQAAAEVDRTPLAAGNSPILDTFYGAFNGRETPGIPNVTTILGHQRLLIAPLSSPTDFTYSDESTVEPTGRHTDFLGYSQLVSPDGRFRIGFGTGDWIGINAAVQIPFQTFSGPAPYINPVGVLNAASFAPFTGGLSRGTVVSIFGTELANGTVQDSTFPTTLSGAQVEVNGILAPIYFASPGQLSFVIPYNLPETATANVRVIRNGNPGNRVFFFVNRTSPGIFTQTASGVGLAAATHANGALITRQNPALPNEAIAVYLTGLGAVDPPHTAGTPAPGAEPLPRVTADLRVLIRRVDAEILYKGLAPLLGGLYQLNFRVPPGTTSGDRFLEVLGLYPDGDLEETFNTQVLLPVGTGSANLSEGERSAEAGSMRSRRPARPRGPVQRGPQTSSGRAR